MHRQIAISIAPGSDNHNGQIRGILDYVQNHHHLSVYKQCAIPYIPLAELPKWEGHGAICYADSVEHQQLLAALPYPCVCVDLHQKPYPGLPVVHSDSHAIGRLAAQHLMEMGLEHFAFVGHLAWYHNQLRWEGFRSTAIKAGYACDAIGVKFLRSRRRSGPLDVNRRLLAAKLASLQFPIGIFAAHDEFAHDVVELLHAANVRVPYDAAVVGVNNYRLICETTEPPLSSIAQSAESIGYEAAKLLDQLMKGGRTPKKPILFPPGGLVARRSSDYQTVDDEAVLQALNFIRTNCGNPITAEDVVQQSSLSRRTLDKRFCSTLGHPIAEEIRLTRIRKARELLTHTDTPVTMVGLTCGYDSPSGFARAFREAQGEAPKQFRQRVRPVR